MRRGSTAQAPLTGGVGSAEGGASTAMAASGAGFPGPTAASGGGTGGGFEGAAASRAGVAAPASRVAGGCDGGGEPVPGAPPDPPGAGGPPPQASSVASASQTAKGGTGSPADIVRRHPFARVCSFMRSPAGAGGATRGYTPGTTI